MDDLGFNEEKVTLEIGGREYPINFNIGSIYFLSEKYGSPVKAFENFKGEFDCKTIDTICDLIYSALLCLDDNGEPKSPLTQKQIMYGIQLADIGNIKDVLGKAFAKSFPKADTKNPTKAAKAVKTIKTENGTGDIFTPLDEQK